MSVCNAEIVGQHRMCNDTPASPFSAICKCGHKIVGAACASCRHSPLPGCLTCWQGKPRHQCKVTFTDGSHDASATP